jgi:hypothetical protein
VGFQNGGRVWPYHPMQTTGKSPKIKSSAVGLCQVISKMNDAIYRIQKLPGAKLIVVHLGLIGILSRVTRDELINEGAVSEAQRLGLRE